MVRKAKPSDRDVAVHFVNGYVWQVTPNRTVVHVSHRDHYDYLGAIMRTMTVGECPTVQPIGADECKAPHQIERIV